MHKETVNTFTKGMVKDTHPLTTPADVLTDCLNGTLITYNGNEMILQNDMGNVLIGSAELPSGYIPVGITEYGGIIYVASYNPLTGKSQIGSFPSPLQRHMSEIWSLASEEPLVVTAINLSSFYSGNDIVSTEIRQPLSLNASGQNMYKLYPGDKFRIQKMTGTETAGPIALDSSIAPYIDMLLGIVKKDGTIEIINDLDYLDGNEHVYTGKSSGYPILIIKLKTIKSFNLSRTYSRGATYTENDETHDTVSITFLGSVEEEVPGCFTGLGGQVQTPSGGAVTLTGTSNSVTLSNLRMTGLCNYSIYPVLLQGNMTSMRKTGVIDLSKFRENKKEITAWSYLVLDNYVKVNWSFDYYSLDDSIDKVVFEVYNLLSADPLFNIEIILDSYNGSFELIINFDNVFKKDDIYIVRIMGYTGQVEDLKLGSRMIYTSGIFNDYYGRVVDFTNVGFAAAAPEAMDEQQTAFLDTIKCKLTATVTPIDVTYEEETDQNPINTITVTGPNGLSENYRGLKNLTSNCFTARTDNVGTGYFTVSINRKYKFEVTLKLDIDEPKYGFVSDKTKEKILESYLGSVLEFVNKNIKQGTISVIPPTEGQDPDSFTVTLAGYNPTGEVITPQEGEEDPSILKLKFEKVNGTYTPLSLDTLMRVKCSSVKNTTIRRTALRPLYQPDLSMSLKDKILSCWNTENLRMCCGADENNVHYNSTLAGGSVVWGTDTGAGHDDTGLNTAMEQMNLPMVSMFAGVDGDQASYSPDDIVFDPAGHFFLRNTVNGWGCDDNEIDDTDNWLITVWKQSDKQYRFLNLASRRTEKTKGEVLARLDIMLRCMLSQILTTQMFADSVKYVTTSASDLGYYLTLASAEVKLQLSELVDYNNVEYKTGHFTLNDIIYGEDAIYELINAKSEIIDLNTEVLNIKYTYVIEEDTPAVEFGQEFATDEIASLFTGAEYSIDESQLNDGSNPKLIYVIDWSKVSNLGGNNVYSVRSDGTYEWKISDLTRIAKVSGYTDGTSFDTLVTSFSPTDSDSPCYAGSLTADNPDTLKMSWYSNADWYFYNSFNHVFMTYCRWMDEDISEDKYNEIVINRDTGHIGATNASGVWRKRKDDAAPDIIAALSNRQNSIYKRFKGNTLFPTPAF